MKAFSLIRTAVVLACVAMLLLTSCGGLGPASHRQRDLDAHVTMSTAIVAEGRVLPLQFARLSFALAGTVWQRLRCVKGELCRPGSCSCGSTMRGARAVAEARLHWRQLRHSWRNRKGCDAQRLRRPSSVAAAQATVNATRGLVNCTGEPGSPTGSATVRNARSRSNRWEAARMHCGDCRLSATAFVYVSRCCCDAAKRPCNKLKTRCGSPNSKWSR